METVSYIETSEPEKYEKIFIDAISFVLTNKNFHLFNETILNIEKLKSDAYAHVMNVDAETCRNYAIRLEEASLKNIITTSDSTLFDILKKIESPDNTEETPIYEKNETIVLKYGSCVIDDSITDIDALREELENLGFDWDICVLYLYGDIEALKEKAKLDMQLNIRRRLAIKDCYMLLNDATQSLRDIAKELKQIMGCAYYNQKSLWDDNKEKYAVLRKGTIIKTDINRFPTVIKDEIERNQGMIYQIEDMRNKVLDSYEILWGFMRFIDPNNI